MTAVLATGTEADKDWRLSLYRGVVLIEFVSGTIVTPDMLKRVYHELNSEPEKYRTTNVVWDLRNIVLDRSVGFDEVLRIVRHIKDSWDDRWKIDKSALVVSNKTAFGISRIYASLVDSNLDYKVEIFENDLEAAVKWARPSG